MMTVYCIRQIDGGARYVALSPAAARLVQNDPTILDYVPVEAILDIDPDRKPIWVWTKKSADSSRGRSAIRAYLGAETP